MKSVDLEKLNRKNFRAMINALSMPGNIDKIKPLYDSYLLALANILLYSEISFFYEGKEDMSIVEAITNAKKESIENADYIFCDVVEKNLITRAKKGDYINPDFSATLIFTCKDNISTKAVLSGPGINNTKEVNLPCDKNFIEELMKKNSEYPLGIEVFFLMNDGEILALSRTTKVEVI
ncbi:phosphonate C-P lyase system protein PhnH [Sulfurospirillum sp. 1307]|jgi:alpha-D-ribose 1-methylphosphonate 5-triphosphate synthase subunit PhnH